MFNQIKTDYEWAIYCIRHPDPDLNVEYKLIDCEKDTYIVYADETNGFLYAEWFKNGMSIHEVECRIKKRG
jgi:hypothetical protein